MNASLSLFRTLQRSRRQSLLRHFCLLSLGLWCCGCQRAPVGEVSGQVTYNGEAIRYGAITFSPVDGNARTAGALVKNGKYRAIDVPVGEQFVQVAAGIPPESAATSTSIPKQEAHMTIPANALGNGAKHKIVEGEQFLDLKLSSQ